MRTDGREEIRGCIKLIKKRDKELRKILETHDFFIAHKRELTKLELGTCKECNTKIYFYLNSRYTKRQVQGHFYNNGKLGSNIISCKDFIIKGIIEIFTGDKL